FVEAGAQVYLSSRKAEGCDQVAAELSRQGTCGSLPADCSTEAGARGLADALARREPALHILVNNAGANWGAPLAEYPDSAWDKVLALNVKGVFHLTRTCLPLLERAARPGDPARVINIGSIDGLHVPVLETYAYSASKAAVHHLTRVLAHRLAAQNITVNAIAPGPFESKMMHETLERFRDAIVASCPLGRIGEPEDVAGAAIYLASRAGAFLTGAVIPVYVPVAFSSIFLALFLALAGALWSVGALVAGPHLARAYYWLVNAGFASVAGLLCYGYTFGRRQLAVSHLEVPVRGLPSALDGLRIVHLSDLHVGAHLGLSELCEHVERVNALAPDLICLTGDLVDRPETCPEAFPTLAGLRARHG